MPAIPLKDLNSTLKSAKKEDLPQVWLIYGEEFLYKGALDAAVNFLVPVEARTLNYDPLDGGNENVPKALERVNTYSLIPGVKVVALRDARIFYSKEDKGSLLEKTKSAVEKNELKKASGLFVTLLHRLNLKFDDLEKGKRRKLLGIDMDEEPAWLDKLLGYCEEKSVSLSAEASDAAGMIAEAMEKGFPSGHFLIVTTDTANKTHPLFKAIKQDGLVVDCSVPRGERKADKQQQEAILSQRKSTILSRSGKKMDGRAYRAMVDMIGFDIRSFENDLEKLVNYVGQRENITIEDVQSVVKRTRVDPIYEFTNAVTERNPRDILFLLNSMLAAGTHPLQLLTAVVNQIRRLILAKGFVKSPEGAAWHKGATYNHFQDKVMDALIEYDRALLERLQDWEEQLAPEDPEDAKTKPGKKTPKKKAAPKSDLTVVKNPKSPFPVYQTLKKSDNFTFEELKDALRALSNADILMKSTAQDPKRVLENVLFEICGLKTGNKS